MHAFQRALVPAISDIWWSMLSNRIVELPMQAYDEVPFVVGGVRLIGNAQATVVFSCGERLAREAAASMFDISVADVSDAEIRDAVAELTNVAAGNLKGLLPGAHGLSLPTVVNRNEQRAHLVRGQPVAQCAFASHAGAFTVAVYEGPE